MIDIRKVKWDGKKVEIHSTETVRLVETEKVTRSVQTPSPAFQKVFTAAIAHAAEILQLDDSYVARDFAVTGFSLNTEEADGRSGIVLTCQKKLSMANSPAVFNTPHLREPVESEERGSPGFYGSDLGRLMESVREVAVKYLEGEREQRDAFADKKADEAPKKKDPQLSLVDGGAKKKTTAKRGPGRPKGSGKKK